MASSLSSASSSSSAQQVQVAAAAALATTNGILAGGGGSDAPDFMTFEIAWEVCNKVGGIHTVIRTKVPETTKYLGDDYCLIGPLAELAKTEVEVEEPPPVMARAIASMTEAGVKVVFGRWLIEGNPMVVLFDVGAAKERAAEWKKDLWEQVHIGAPWEDDESTNAIVFGYLVAWFLGEYAHQGAGSKTVVAHFHEWLAGVGLILCRVRKINVATVFTTHATLLGRYLCADPKCDFYNNLPRFDVDKEAGDRGIYHRYCIERASTHAAHIFTTVSHITAYEAEHLLKRKVDYLTPNGLNVVKFSALHEFQNLHAKAKAKINRFVQGHFYGHMDFDLAKTVYFFTAGRYEYVNKGADMYLESLARLNHMLKEAGSDTTVVAFLIMPAKTENYNVESLQGQAVTKGITDTVEEIQRKIGQRLFEQVVAGKMPEGDLLDRDDRVQLKRALLAANRSELPPVVTHNVVDDHKDPVLNHIRRCKLFNDHNDRVKVIFHPKFLNPSSPLLPMDYEEFVRGCHLGVFVSYYEPWGYTPAECTMLGIPSITSDLSGFGLFMRERVHEPESYGISVIDRRFKPPEDSIQQLTERMYDFCCLNRRQRINLRNRTERLSDELGWATLEANYLMARRMALHALAPERFENPRDKSKFEQRASAANSPKLPNLAADPGDDLVPMAQLTI